MERDARREEEGTSGVIPQACLYGDGGQGLPQGCVWRERGRGLGGITASMSMAMVGTVHHKHVFREGVGGEGSLQARPWRWRKKGYHGRVFGERGEGGRVYCKHVCRNGVEGWITASTSTFSTRGVGGFNARMSMAREGGKGLLSACRRRERGGVYRKHVFCEVDGNDGGAASHAGDVDRADVGAHLVVVHDHGRQGWNAVEGGAVHNEAVNLRAKVQGSIPPKSDISQDFLPQQAGYTPTGWEINL
jgi:hypothetical protein